MKALFKQKGANLDINILASDEAQSFINSHASTLDSSFKRVKMSDAMRQRLQRSNYIFSGIKTFHELNEAFPSLVDENGDRKSFERFLNDVRKIDKTYNEHYLRAEYNFIHSSAQMASKWEQYAEDGDRYNLQYRTAGDSKVRPEHAALNGVTLPMSDPFWAEYYPPNGWNCFTGVTPVLTAEGWKPIACIRKGDLVVGGSGKLRPVVGTHTKEVDDELVCIIAKGAMATCTENHRFYTLRGWIAAADLQRGDVIVQLGKISPLHPFVNAIGNAHTILRYTLVTLIGKRKAVAPLTIHHKVEAGNVKVNNIVPEKLSRFEWQAFARQIAGHDTLGLAQWQSRRTHTLGMQTAGGNGSGDSLSLDIRTKKCGTYSQLFGNIADKSAIALILTLSYMKTFLCKVMVCCSKFLSGFCSALRISYPLCADGITTMADSNAARFENANDSTRVYAPMGGKPADTPLFCGISQMSGSGEAHAFNGFYTLRRLLGWAFFHNRYIIVEGKVTKKKARRTVYNLSVFKDESYVVPIGIAHNCRCTVVQVRRSKYTTTPHDEAMSLGEEALQRDTKGIFHFNPGKERKSVPDYNPYTIRRCRDCDIAKGKIDLAYIPENELCGSCKLIRCINENTAATIKKNQEIYDRLKQDNSYKDVQFNSTNGGLKGTHQNHNFDKNKGWYEHTVQDVGFQNGHSVILEAERQNAFGEKSCEGTWDDSLFEVAGAETATANNIRNALKHCASKPDCKIAVIFFPNENFSAKTFDEGYAKYYGLKGSSQYRRFNLVYCIQGNKIIQIKKPSE